MSDEIRKAMSAIQQNIEALQRDNVELTRGPAGPRGEKGDKGESPSLRVGDVTVGVPSVSLRKTENGYALDFVLPAAQRGEPGERGARGIPGPEPKMRIANVVSGDVAQADLRSDGEIHELSLVLPRGKNGADGKSIVGPAGKDGSVGPAGKDGTVGPAGEAGPAGHDGKDGLAEDEIRKIVVETIISTLSNVGVLTEQAQKLVAIRAELKKAIHSADYRHQAQVSEIIRRVDALF